MPKGLPRSLRARNRINSPTLETLAISLGSPAVGAINAVMAAFTDNASYHRFYNAAAIWSSDVAKQITATFGGTAADIKAIGIIVVGTDSADAPLTETLPVATVNTAGSVTSVGSFKTITSITIPAHDGTGATTSLGVYGAGAADVIAAWTDVGVQVIHKTATITNPVVPRNVTATSAGTAADINDVQAIVYGTARDGSSISETLPIFTENSGTTVVGSKAFATITWIDLPIHDGTGATTAFGTGAKLGLPYKFSYDTVLAAFLAAVREATRPTVAVSASAIESNTIALSTALNSTEVVVHLQK
jgi:hypothetical protein